MQPPALPRFTLREGPWEVDVFDPRPDPHVLGARYVHGGYIAELRHRGVPLTNRPKPAWNPYEGMGFPEVFEFPLGFAAAEVGQPYLRVGAGRLMKTGIHAAADGALAGTVRWNVLHASEASVAMACSDAQELPDSTIAYTLTRAVTLTDSALESTTTLRLTCPWSHPVVWFPHPFFAQSRGDATGFRLPAGAAPRRTFHQDAQGWWRLESAGGFSPITGVWGAAERIPVRLDPALGAPDICLEHSWPLDKLVVYGTAQAASIEPYLARFWHDGEEASWTLRYAWRTH